MSAELLFHRIASHVDRRVQQATRTPPAALTFTDRQQVTEAAFITAGGEVVQASLLGITPFGTGWVLG